jgi:iron(III) transport system permease protein
LSIPASTSIGARTSGWSLRRLLPPLEPLFAVHLAVILVLCVLVLYPIGIIVNQSIRNDDGGLSLDWYLLAYSNLRNYQAILNTLVIAAGSALFAIAVGTLLAWAVVRTDMPGRQLVELASIIPFISTPLVGALAWILLASPQTGLINQVWRYLGAAGSVVDIYSIWGIIFVEAVYETPLVFLLVSGALRSMDPTLEEAARSAGAGTLRTALRITLPLVLPAILAGGLLVFILAAEQFAVPAVLGTPGKIRVLTTSIFEAQSVYPARDGLAAALSGILMVIALGGLWLHRRLLAGRSFVTVKGKSAQTRRVRLGGLGYVLLGICCLYLVLAVGLPLSTIFLSSIRKIWTAEFHWEQFTLDNYRVVLFSYPTAQRAIVNSLLLAVLGALATILFCALISFLSLRTRYPGHKLLDALAMIPAGFPGIVLAVGLLHAWISPPLVLYGTIWILYVAYLTRYLPLGVRAVSASLMQIHPELEESAAMSGASWFQTFRHIVLPLLRPGLAAGWALLFVAFTRELSASILLYSPKLEVLSVVIYTMYQEGGFRTLSALTMLQVAIAVVVLVVAKRITRLDTTAEGHAM